MIQDLWEAKLQQKLLSFIHSKHKESFYPRPRILWLSNKGLEWQFIHGLRSTQLSFLLKLSICFTGTKWYFNTYCFIMI